MKAMFFFLKLCDHNLRYLVETVWLSLTFITVMDNDLFFCLPNKVWPKKCTRQCQFQLLLLFIDFNQQILHSSASKYAVRNILLAKLGHNISLEVMSYLLYFINWVFASHIQLHLKKLEKRHSYAQFTRTKILRCDLLFSCANLIKTMGWRWGGFLLTLRERGASINYLVLSGWVFHKHEEPHAFLE